MNEVVTLYLRTPGTDDVTKREVFAGLRSIGMTEFYQANAQDIQQFCTQSVSPTHPPSSHCGGLPSCSKLFTG